ncbi:insoluble matrix shell protein 5-like [Crassostrea angulata]|uniref:insoluble matrix shell protein 5 n=1 Tax=Magallana gigas TaxID=29159 RepID=UPI0005C3C2EE|nr:insoluble matrix shell protein 5-like [Crassostrea angulata]|eukprot:XP_011429273.1 PREDICTED: insoluble matrix shell protein 5 [Crassostrea gigas]
MIAFILSCILIGANAGPFPEGSDAEARYVFHLADKDGNYSLSLAEFQRIFFDFDRNHDKSVTSDEFLLDWMERHLGSSLEAVILFHHLDVDRNGHIEDTDIPWILAFFDRNMDGVVGQAEFVITWLKLINSPQSR